eukprot:356139-Chlamydomonas_euryale.AAC.3
MRSHTPPHAGPWCCGHETGHAYGRVSRNVGWASLALVLYIPGSLVDHHLLVHIKRMSLCIWLDRWINGWINGWIDGWING